MEIVRIDVDRKDFDVVIFGDIHYGAANVAHSLVDDMISDVAEKGMYALNLGDNIEAIAPGDKRFSCSSIDTSQMTAYAQRDFFIEKFRPIRKNIKAIGMGNHEHTLINETNIGQDIATALGTKFCGLMYTAHFFYNDKLLFKFFIAHGARTMPVGAKDPIQREANQKAWLKRQLDQTGISDCILMAMGHTHQLLLQPPTVDNEILISSSADSLHQHTRPNQPQNMSYIAPDRRWYINTGSFLKLYSEPGSLIFGYAEMRMLRPARLGWPEINVVDGEVVDIELREGRRNE